MEDGDKWIPKSLTQFMSHFVTSEAKRVSINHCIVQSARPRSIITPTPFSVGLYMDKNFGSKSLINFLYRLGFSTSSDEVLRFKQSCVEIDETNNDYAEDEGGFVQFVGDNLDHNIATLTGKGTFHGMGIISISNRAQKPRQIARLKERPTSSYCTSVGVPVYFYNGTVGDLDDSLLLNPVQETFVNKTTTRFCDFLWHCNWFFSSDEVPRPHWSGFMQSATRSVVEMYSLKSHIQFLPIIDMDPNDESCIYSTLLFVYNQSLKMQVHTACITFDQPLWFKAFKIVKAEKCL